MMAHQNFLLELLLLLEVVDVVVVVVYEVVLELELELEVEPDLELELDLLDLSSFLADFSGFAFLDFPLGLTWGAPSPLLGCGPNPSYSQVAVSGAF